MNPLVGWALAAVLLVVSYQAYGAKGIAAAITAIVFWLVLQFNRTVRVMRVAAEHPVGLIANAVMFQASLKTGQTMLQVVKSTGSLGRKIGTSGDDWEWHDEGGIIVRLHFARGKLASWQLERPVDGEATADLESPPR